MSKIGDTGKCKHIRQFDTKPHKITLGVYSIGETKTRTQK